MEVRYAHSMQFFLVVQGGNTVKEMAGGKHMCVDACVCAALLTQLLRAPAKELSL